MKSTLQFEKMPHRHKNNFNLILTIMLAMVIIISIVHDHNMEKQLFEEVQLNNELMDENIELRYNLYEQTGDSTWIQITK